MKDWSPDHPKAKLMARKRVAILAAAREVFLRLGYGGASMEAIAAAANVSIMTLYRHSESKDDLFAAVVANACDPTDEAERAAFLRLMQRPLEEMLVVLGVTFQERMVSPETAALLRTVMAESARFPDLAEIAYGGFVGHLERLTEEILAQREEARGLSGPQMQRIAAAFADRLFGADFLRVLLGLRGGTAQDHRQRAERAAHETVAALAEAGRAMAGA